MKAKKITFMAGEEDSGERLDKVLAVRYPAQSRQYFQLLLKDGRILVNEKPAKASVKLRSGDRVEVSFPPPQELDLKPLKMSLNIIYEDKNLIVLDKPAGLVVHPGEGATHREDSLVNALLHHCKGELSGINGVLRPGVVHRLDKDTSGLLVIAKNDHTHRHLVEQFQGREVEKMYYALLVGRLEPLKGSIEAPIGRDPANRKRMAVVSEKKGRMAITKYEVLDYVGDFTFVKVYLITGRTHQIRVHFASIGFPLAGDDLYGKPKINKLLREEHGLARQFLHAGGMAFVLPGASKKRAFETPLPSDLQAVIDSLRSS